MGRYNLVQNIGKDFPTTAVTMYVAHDGDTLQSIAAAMYGNPGLWYLIADANGLSPTDPIRGGSEIKVPNSARTGELTADTHRVYNESDIIGSTLPNLKTPPPPGKGGCASILMIIVVIVIAVLVPGAVAFLANIIGPALFGGAFVATTVSLATVASYAIAGAIVGAAASVITQGVAIALGLQESFSWKAVAAGAVGGAFSGAAQGIGKAAELMAVTGKTVGYAKVAVSALKVAGVASQQLIQNGKITSWSSLAGAGLEGYFGTQAKVEAGLGEWGAFQAGSRNMQVIEQAGLAASKATRELQNTISYITPWVNLAETAARNDGKLTPSDWATAVGSTLGAAAANGAIGNSVFGNLGSAARSGITNLLAGGAMSAFDKEAGKEYLINAAGTWAGQYLGTNLAQQLFPTPARTLLSYGPPGADFIAAADRQEEQNGSNYWDKHPMLYASNDAVDPSQPRTDAGGGSGGLESGDIEVMADFDPRRQVYANEYEYQNRNQGISSDLVTNEQLMGAEGTPGLSATDAVREAYADALNRVTTMDVKQIFDRNDPHQYMIFVVADGTRNDANQAIPTNPRSLYQLIDKSANILPIYISGIETENDLGGLNSALCLGASLQISQTITAINEQVNAVAQVDPDARFIFADTAFSRGAGVIRVVHNVLVQQGVPDLRSGYDVMDGDATRVVYARNIIEPGKVNIGASLLYDTVKTGTLDLMNTRVPSHVQHTLHLTAANEYRKFFS